MIDPLLPRIISLGFALLFLIAAAHKITNRESFRAIFEAYEIVPKRLSGPVAKIIGPLELLLGIGWLIVGVFAIRLDALTLVSICLLMSYVAAIGINLKRGRNYIDCGCSFSRSGTRDSESASQQISSGLLYRNCLLVLMAIVCILPTGSRSLHLIDVFGLLFCLAALTLLYGAYNQILNNRNIINSWRQSDA